MILLSGTRSHMPQCLSPDRKSRRCDRDGPAEGGPRDGRATHCSYCGEPFGPEAPRLIFVWANGVGAELCETCDLRYWREPSQ
jgi:hypothetical protein